MRSFRLLPLIVAFGASFLAAQAPAPSGGGPASPQPVETQPLPPPAAPPQQPPPAAQPAPPAAATPASPPTPAAPPGTPAPPQQAAPAPAAPPPAEPPAAPQQAAPAPSPSGPLDAKATLAPGTTDPSGADEVLLPAKPVASLRGQANWDGGFVRIQAALMVIRTELKKAGIAEAGRPLTVFLTSDDEKFTFEAMVPIDPAADRTKTLGSDVRFSATPTGKAIRFGHKGPYDNIDETYEVLTAYLDAKGIEAKDAFIEEYLTENLPPSDENFELQIYVQPK